MHIVQNTSRISQRLGFIPPYVNLPLRVAQSFSWITEHSHINVHDFQVNQKMMKSALIKDLYIEMDRLKQGILFCCKHSRFNLVHFCDCDTTIYLSMYGGINIVVLK